MEAVAESRADIGLAYNPPAHLGVRSVAISRQPLHVMVAPGRQPSGRKRASLLGVASEPAALEANSIDVVRRFALSGRGTTFLPLFAAPTEVADMATSRPFRCRTCRSWRRGRTWWCVRSGGFPRPSRAWSRSWLPGCRRSTCRNMVGTAGARPPAIALALLRRQRTFPNWRLMAATATATMHRARGGQMEGRA